MMKFIVLVGDGMGDHPIAELQNKTPLEAAHTPTMDFIAGHGRLLRLRTVPEGYPPGSDVANLSLAGYKPQEFYTGRSPLEAASMGVDLAEGEVAFRCNLVTVEHLADGKVKMIDYSAGHISTEEANELIAALAANLNDSQYKLHAGISYRHLLVRKGETEGLQTVPPHDHTNSDVSKFAENYKLVPGLAEFIDKAAGILKDHPVNQNRVAKGLNPANAVWLWGEGKSPSMPTLKEQYGISGALISAVDLLKGIGVYAGMEIINVPGATGYLDTNYEGKAAAAIDMLNHKDLVFVHVEAPDEAGHQGLLKEKIQAIEDFDLKIVKPIFEAASSKYDFRMVVTTDHYTPLELRTHTSTPVPVAIYDSRDNSVAGDAVFSEKNADKSGQLLENGQDLMKILLGRK